jgi:cyclophilin family peptidyl-prolyl cis-trans isomerase
LLHTEQQEARERERERESNCVSENNTISKTMIASMIARSKRRRRRRNTCTSTSTSTSTSNNSITTITTTLITKPQQGRRRRRRRHVSLLLLPLVVISVLLLSIILCATNIVHIIATNNHCSSFFLFVDATTTTPDYYGDDVEDEDEDDIAGSFVDLDVNANANIIEIEAGEKEEQQQEGSKIIDGTIKTKTKKDSNENNNKNNNNNLNNNCQQSVYDPSILSDPCKLDKTPITTTNNKNNDEFSILFPTQYGDFVAHCDRRRAPIQADRIYRLAKYGYYNLNYFFRVIPGKYIQFGTNGNPLISNVYNYTSMKVGEDPDNDDDCSIIQPQPPYMPYCMAEDDDGTSDSDNNCTDVPGLSNSFGTISMSTSYKEGIPGYPDGVTWNATAELFINIGNNAWLDSNLFIPICTINKYDMNNVVLKFPSFGEVSELGGDGPSLGLLYQYGNIYIESNINSTWNDTMAITSTVSICTDTDTDSARSGSSSSSSSGYDYDYVEEKEYGEEEEEEQEEEEEEEETTTVSDSFSSGKSDNKTGHDDDRRRKEKFRLRRLFGWFRRRIRQRQRRT